VAEGEARSRVRVPATENPQPPSAARLVPPLPEGEGACGAPAAFSARKPGDRGVEGKVLAGAGAAVLVLDIAGGEAAGAEDELVGEADQVHRGEFRAGRLVPVVVEHIDAGGAEFGVEFVRRLAARMLEENGIPSVVMGCAKDIVEHAAVPRFLFSDFPLGNSAGKPHDMASQALTLELALAVLETAPGPQTTVQSPLRWSADHGWKRDYSNAAMLSAEELARRRREFDAQKAVARGLRDTAA